MEMKEFHYEDGLRVSLFNLDHEAVPYHFHDHVADIMYCARGRITIELPDPGQAYSVGAGEVFQVPDRSRHRFFNGAPVGTPSRYVLLQIGSFDITFLPDAEDIAERFADLPVAPVTDGIVHVGDRKGDILALADRFEQDKPQGLTTDEQADVVRALRSLAARGVDATDPRAVVGP
ncbi:MAG: hypothetical protein AVDCRST_MAG41-246 [uncultured Corynebacteriales bacterium]|uniref:Cupin type-2 domain-containing protein n=1 Tax=uncultured Mycobacteriales bacterium TaxID=581187 RepID=A0A6J4H869_9ACTN|nr:MAG: hypothetical protein AVDCRST_MAG41-246 [uncultured Corynebacteriales bacterium]